MGIFVPFFKQLVQKNEKISYPQKNQKKIFKQGNKSFFSIFL